MPDWEVQPGAGGAYANATGSTPDGSSAGSGFGAASDLVGSGISAGVGVYDTMSTNSANAAMQQQAEAFDAQQAINAQNFSAQQVAQQQSYDTMMSDTSYQRGMADMKAAGLNPMLAYSQGGASTPTSGAASGQAASAPTPPRMENVLGAGVSSAEDFLKLKNTFAETNSRVAKNVADGKLSIAAAKKADADAKYSQDANDREAGLYGSAQAKAAYEADTSKFNRDQLKKYGDWDAWSNRISKYGNSAQTIKDLLNPFSSGNPGNAGGGTLTPEERDAYRHYRGLPVTPGSGGSGGGFLP